jgi:hypothetical protein
VRQKCVREVFLYFELELKAVWILSVYVDKNLKDKMPKSKVCGEDTAKVYLESLDTPRIIYTRVLAVQAL